MSWDRFHYLCRRYSQSGEEQAPFTALRAQWEGEASTALYGAPLQVDSLAAELLEGVGRLDSGEQQQRAAGIYGRLDCNALQPVTTRSRGITAYLALLGLVFVLISGLFQFKVAPQMLAVLQDFRLEPPAALLHYTQFWPALVAGTALLLLFAFLLGAELRAIAMLRTSNLSGVLSKALIPLQIRNQYQLLLDLLHYPLQTESDTQPLAQSLEGLDEAQCATELQALLRRHSHRLNRMIDWYLRGVTLITAVAVVMVIFFFISSAYQVLFLLGELQ